MKIIRIPVLENKFSINCIEISYDDLFIAFEGPENSIWENGVFKLTMTFTEDYPNKPPTVKMKTKVFHPNFYVDGNICIDILKNQWSPIYDIKSILTSIQSLLTDPNPSSPANVEAAKLYSDNIQEYNKRVKDCVEVSIAEAEND